MRREVSGLGQKGRPALLSSPDSGRCEPDARLIDEIQLVGRGIWAWRGLRRQESSS